MKGTLNTKRDENNYGANNRNNPCWCIFQRVVKFFCHVCTFVNKTTLSVQYIFWLESDGGQGNDILHGAELMQATASKECFPTYQGIKTNK